MKINFIPIFFFLTLSFSITAQESSIIVLNLNGQIEYLIDQSDTVERLFPGMKVSDSGALNLKKGAKVNLLYNGKLIQLDEEGVYELKTLTEKNDKALSMSFAGRFWDFVSVGLSQTDDNETLNDYSKQLLAVTGGVQGYAEEGLSIQTIMPADGNIGAEIVTFNWYHSTKADVYYLFKIYQAEEEQLVFQASIRDTSITLDFTQLVFHPNEVYQWSVEMQEWEKDGEGKEMVKSDSKNFEYFLNVDEIIVQKAEKISDYKKADDFEKKWMQAIVMEQENFIYDAYNRYLSLRSQHPENLLIKKLFAAFLVRQGLTLEAVEQLK